MVLLPNITNLKVSLIVSDLSTHGAGRWGGAVRPFLLSQALRQLGCEVEILGFSFGQPSDALSDSDIPIVAVESRPYPQFFSDARTLLRQVSGDVIYAYKPRPTSFGVALMSKWMTHRPLILDIDDWELSWHGGDEWRYNPSLRQLARDLLKPDSALRQPDHPLYLRWMERCVRYADKVTLHNQFLQTRFGGTYIPNGKNTELFDPQRYDAEASRDKYGLAGYRTLMFPGAPRPYKGLEDVLAALEILNEPDLRLVIVGGSPYDDYDSYLIKHWGQWIVKLPKFSVQEMPAVIAAAHIIVVPQRDHPTAKAQFPLKLTDGMAMAKPVLAARVGDIPDILGDTGYLVDPNSPEQLAESIRWIFQHPQEATAKGMAARERCCKFYSISTMADTLANILADLKIG